MLSHKLIKCYFASRRRIPFCKSKTRVLSISLLLYIFDIMQTRVYSTRISQDYITVEHQRDGNLEFSRHARCVRAREFSSSRQICLRVKSAFGLNAQLESHSKQIRLFRQTENIVLSECRSELRDHGQSGSNVFMLAARQIRSLHSYRAYFLRAVSLLGSMRNYEAISVHSGFTWLLYVPCSPAPWYKPVLVTSF